MEQKSFEILGHFFIIADIADIIKPLILLFQKQDLKIRDVKASLTLAKSGLRDSISRC